ncbi:HRDC domain-containing protein [Candidatus Thiothrix anitrata]|uniref:HRDC domain-containing protein n=1 Tax=Candidatus Thiothrix anitrata TaxID=2823902 RepID=UPI001D1908F6|nr:HRDC domain-containing protein [Candidatus Thiothrix anitrata]
MSKDDEHIRQFRHEQLSTFGIGKEHSDAEWRNIFRQLIALGYLTVDVDGHGGLRLTDNARPLLRGEIELHLRKEQKRERVRRDRVRGDPVAKPRFNRDTMPIEVEALWEALRALRLRLAQEQGVPPYVIFHDSTLLQMADERPQTLEAMRGIAGIGERKLAQYGQAFLDVVLGREGGRLESAVLY